MMKSEAKSNIPATDPAANPSSVANKRQKLESSGSVSSKANPTDSSAVPGVYYRGLRFFSEMVAKKVEAKGSTTYQEVADELVNECISGEMNNRSDAISSATKQVVEHKNIRRRVYDALNVLMAMDIIRKDKKLIHWQGLPDLRTGTGSEVGELEKEKTAREIEVNKKREALFKLLQQQVLFRNLVKHNREKQKRKGTPTKQTVSLPFCVVTYPGDTKVNIQVDPEQRDVLLQFDGAFQIYDDKDVLKKKNL